MATKKRNSIDNSNNGPEKASVSTNITTAKKRPTQPSTKECNGEQQKSKKKNLDTNNNNKKSDEDKHNQHRSPRRQKFDEFIRIKRTHLNVAVIVVAVIVGLLILNRDSLGDLDPREKLFRANSLLSEYYHNLITTDNTTESEPGKVLAHAGYTPLHPVAFIPGIISSGLEVWQGKECAEKHFRQRFWGTSLMFQKLLLDRKCWLEHVKLNQTTWKDPEGIKLRAAAGLVAADYLFLDFWIWGKLIQNLAFVGYDETNMYMASYDWRLPFKYLEERDHYFSRLKMNIELMKQTKGQKVVIVSHSMGSLIWLYFLKWVESDKGGRAGPTWVHDHIEANVNIGGPLLGAPKMISAITSGEMRDMIELNSVMKYIQEAFITNRDLLDVFRSFGSIPSMTPKGGNRIWGNATFAPDAIDGKHYYDGNMISFAALATIAEVGEHPKEQPTETETDSSHTLADSVTPPCDQDELSLEPMIDAATKQGIVNYSYPIDEAMDVIRKIAPNYMKQVDHFYSFGLSRDPNLASNPKYDDPKYWANPLETALPKAPNMKVYCIYGVGKDTERSYHYSLAPESSTCSNIPFAVDVTAHNITSKLRYGVQLGDGDGTVPLTSLSYMCVKGWKDPVYNPSNVKVVTREYVHQEPHLDLNAIRRARPGTELLRSPTSADHVDIMGNHDVIRDIIHIVTGHFGAVDEDLIFSDATTIASRINLDE